jgi:FtsP/CotA-like multicopper oxidase with cupredoxin domain
VQNGTYWYHSHRGSQEQIGLIGALVIEPWDKEPITYNRNYIVLPGDWSDTNPDTLYGNQETKRLLQLPQVYGRHVYPRRKKN